MSAGCMQQCLVMGKIKAGMRRAFRLSYLIKRFLVIVVSMLFKRELAGLSDYILGLSIVTVSSGTNTYSPFLLFHL